MSVHFTFHSKKNSKKRGRAYSFIVGAGSIGFDQKMETHHVLSDREAFAKDRIALKKDVSKVWHSMVKREFDDA